jgi:branched-chain amino acid transport system permease protein
LQILLDICIGGVTLGGMYALIAFTLSLALATTHVLNVAHGSIIVLGSALATFLLGFLHLNPALAVLIFLVAFLLLGFLFEAGIVKRMLHQPPDTVLIASIVTTFGLALALETCLGFYWARLVHPEPSFSLTFRVPAMLLPGGLVLPTRRLIILAFAVVAIALFHLFLKRTRLGKEARALSQNYEGALVVGVNPRAVSMAIFTLGMAVTALCGAFFVLTVPLDPYDGMRLTLVALIIVVLGGVGSLPGVLVAGLLLGIAEVVTGFLLGPAWSPVVFLGLLFLMLMLRPEGLLGERH